MIEVGDRVTVTIGAVAHGGHCVARLDGQVVFVRHGLPGEVVVAEVTEIGPRRRFLRADVVTVVEPSPERVPAPCEYAGTCGGCDFQHASLSLQRELKSQVVAEQLQRLAGLERSIEVESLNECPDGLGWRTRMSFSVTTDGEVGLRRHRSHDVVPIKRCAIAHPLIDTAAVTAKRFPDEDRVDVAVSVATGAVSVTTAGSPVPSLTEHAAGRDWRVSGGGFWQIHPGAAELLAKVVLEQLQPRAGDHVIDLYAGVGLFAGALVDRLGPGGRMDIVESSGTAVADAEVNLAGAPTVHIHPVTVQRFFQRTPLRRCDLVVLDPPRTGAGEPVLVKVARLRPRRISYVACDPAALARDVATLASCGYHVSALRAFDLFPMTHHFECVALFERAGSGADAKHSV